MADVVESRKLDAILADLRPYAQKTLGSIRIGVDEVAVIVAALDERARLSQAGAGGVVPAAGRDKLVGEALAKFLPLVSTAAGSEDVPVPADDFAVILGLLKAGLPNQASAVEAAYERALRQMEATFRRNKERSSLVALMREKFRSEIAALADTPPAPVPTASVEAVLALIDTHEATARERADKLFEMDLPSNDPGAASAFAVRNKLIEIGEKIRALTPAPTQGKAGE